MVQERVKAIQEFWWGSIETTPEYAKEQAGRWFQGGEEVDREITERFKEDVLAATRGEYDSWKGSAQTLPALLVLLDQFTRNIFRGTAQMYTYDEKALSLAQWAVDSGLDQEVHPFERLFLYLPFEHSEDLRMQEKSLELFAKMRDEGPAPIQKILASYWDYAEAHHVIIERFGRFPHRNEILGRDSTPEEREFLKQPGSSF